MGTLDDKSLLYKAERIILDHLAWTGRYPAGLVWSEDAMVDMIEQANRVNDRMKSWLEEFQKTQD